MTPKQRVQGRIREIEARIERRRQRAARLRSASRIGTRQSAIARAKHRREQLEQERPDWERLIRKNEGALKAIAMDMGCCKQTAERAIWDLGLWPLLVEVRRQRK